MKTHSTLSRLPAALSLGLILALASTVALAQIPSPSGEPSAPGVEQPVPGASGGQGASAGAQPAQSSSRGALPQSPNGGGGVNAPGPGQRGTRTRSGPGGAGSNFPAYSLVIKDGYIVENGQNITKSTLLNVLEYLHKKYPEISWAYAINRLPSDGNDLTLDKFDVDDCSLSFSENSGWALATNIERYIRPDSGHPMPNITIYSGPEKNSYVFAFSAPTENFLQVKVFNLSDYLATVPEKERPIMVDTITKIINDAVGTLHYSKNVITPQPEYMFHAGTGLLVLTGTAETVAVADQVIDALDSHLPAKPSTPSRKAIEPPGGPVPQ